MSDLQGALGLAQLEKLDRFVERRRELAACYDEAFADLGSVETPFVPDYAVPNYQSYIVRLRDADRCELTIAVHAPCTQRNVTAGQDALLELLDAVPGVTVIALSGGLGCCGAAGNKMFEPESNADELAKRLLAPLRDVASVDLLLSPNIGCAWHLRAHLVQSATPVPVMHPARLLAQRLAAGRRDDGVLI